MITKYETEKVGESTATVIIVLNYFYWFYVLCNIKQNFTAYLAFFTKAKYGS